MNALLGYRPSPLQGDTHLDCLLRLAYAYGIGTLPQFLQAIGMEKPKLTRWYEWKPKQQQNLISALSKVCRRDMTEEISSLMTIGHLPWLNEPDRMFKHILVDFPRVCPKCVLENERLDWRWALGTVARCYEHKCNLLDTCPICGKAYKWHSSILKCCPNCQLKWADLSIPTTPIIRRYGVENVTWPSLNGDITQPIYLAHICAAIAAMARPFDTAYVPRTSMPYSKEHSKLVLQAMSVLHRKTFPDWVQEITDNRKQALPNEPSPISMFKRHVGYSTLSKNGRRFPKFPIFERNEYVVKKDSKDVTEQEPNIGRYYINLFNLATALGLTVADLNYLTSDGFIPCAVNAETVENRLFNTLDVSQLLLEHMSKDIKGETMTVNASEPLLIEHHLTYGDLLHSTWTDVIDGSMASPLMLGAIIVSKPQFIALLQLEPCQRNRNSIKQLMNSHQS